MTEKNIDYHNEVWKPVVGAELLYIVSNMGRVMSLPQLKITQSGSDYTEGKIKSLRENIHGYLVTDLYPKPQQKETRTVHSLVAEAFLGKRPKDFVTDHKNGDRKANWAENLEYVSPRENTHRGKGTKNPHPNIHYYKGVYRVRIRVKGVRLYAESKYLEKAIEKRDSLFMKLNIELSGKKNVDMA